MDGHKIAIIYSTFGSIVDARSCISVLLEDRIIACATCHVIESNYNWKDENCLEEEFAVHFKTSTNLLSIVTNKIKKIHPYETPAILSWLANANEDYATWVLNQVKNASI